jgi:hypothetical protein
MERLSSKSNVLTIFFLIVETIGYGARAAAHFKTDSTIVFALQSLFILLGPILVAASTYMVLGRIITGMRGEKWSPISTRWLTRMFVAGDILCFVIQAGGGGIESAAKSQKTLDLGNWVIFAGLCVQVVIFAGFIATAAAYHYRANKAGRRNDTSMPWVRMLTSVYAVSGLIMIRNVFRIAEYALGRSGYLLTHEWALYVFDACVMAVALCTCIIWYHDSLLPGSAASDISLSSTTEMQPKAEC